MAIISKGKQDFSKKAKPGGGTTVTIVTDGKTDVHLYFDKDGNFDSANAS